MRHRQRQLLPVKQFFFGEDMKTTIARLIVGVTISALAMFSADSLMGTWKFNAAKSKSTSTNKIKSRTEVWEPTLDGGAKVTRTEEWADGSVIHTSYTFKFDGKKYPVAGAPWDTIAVKRVDANTTTFAIEKSEGKLRITGKNSISTDGKTKTLQSKGIDAQGKTVESTTVFDKQ